MASASIVLRKYSPYTKFLKQAVIDIIENGLFDFRNNKISKQQDCKAQRTHGDALGMRKLATLFFMLMFGCMISYSICFFEYFSKPQKQQENDIKKQKMTEYENAFCLVKNLIPQMDENLKENAEWILIKMQDVYKNKE